MLTKFAVQNYRGFSKKIEWNLSHPSNYEFNDFAVTGGVVRNAIIYGPNGSGKTSFGLAIFDIANHLSHKWKKPDYYLNFTNGLAFNQPVRFEYTFKFDDNVLEYAYSKNAQDGKGILIEEYLFLNGKEVFSKNDKTLYISDEFETTKLAKDNLRDGGNNVSIINYLLNAIPLAKDHYLIKLRDFVENMLFFRSLDYREFIGLNSEVSSNIEEYIINKNLIDDFAQFLKDTSKQEYTFAKPVLGEKILYCLMGQIKMPFLLVASTGTLNLELQYYWLKEMDRSPFVFIDEFDAFYHHELSYTICKRLFTGDRQVYVTTHDTFLLTNDLLRPDCFFIINNNKIASLSDLTNKEIRYGHNLEKLYRGGTFAQ